MPSRLPDLPCRPCSVIVCTRHRAGQLRRCLESLAALGDSIGETVVVDNTVGDSEIDHLAAEAGARYVVEQHEGLSRARNAGARAATGELIAFIDDDEVVEPSWLQAHCRALEDPSLMATTGRILPISPQPAEAVSGPSPESLDLGDSPFRIDRATPSWFEIVNFGGLGFGGNMVFRRRLFDAGFGFRESLGAGARLGWGEEFYAFFTIIKDGHSVAYVPDAVVRHDSPARTERGTARARRASAAYLAMLLVEEAQFRRRTARYSFDMVRQRRQPWRTVAPEGRQAGGLQMLGAALGGPLLYARSRLDRSWVPQTSHRR